MLHLIRQHWSMFCRSALSTTKSFKKSLVSSICTFKIRTISTLLIDNIVEDHHLIVEMNTRMIDETTIIQMIVETTIIRMIDEMNFEMNFEKETITINFKIVVRKGALYVGNLVVDQSITSKTSVTTRKSAFRIDTHSSETIIVFVSTFWSMKMKKMKTMIMKKWFSISRRWH